MYKSSDINDLYNMTKGDGPSQHHGSGHWLSAEYNHMSANPIYSKPLEEEKVYSDIAKMPIFLEENNTSKRNFKPELLAEALAAKSNLGLVDPTLNSPPLEALNSYSQSTQSSLYSAGKMSQNFYETEKYGNVSNSTDMHFMPSSVHMQQGSQRLFTSSEESHDFIKSDQKRNLETTIKPFNDVVLNSVDEEDRYLYGDSSSPPTPVKPSEPEVLNIAEISRRVRDSGWSDEEDDLSFDHSVSTDIYEEKKYSDKNMNISTGKTSDTLENTLSLSYGTKIEKSFNFSKIAENNNNLNLSEPSKDFVFRDQKSSCNPSVASAHDSKSKYHIAACLLKKHLHTKSEANVNSPSIKKELIHEDNMPENRNIVASKKSANNKSDKKNTKSYVDKKDMHISRGKKLSPVLKRSISKKPSPVKENYYSSKSYSDRNIKHSSAERREERSKEEKYPYRHKSRSRSPRYNSREKSPKYRSPERYSPSHRSHYISKHHSHSFRSHRRSPDNDHKHHERSPLYRSEERSPRRRSRSPRRRSRDRSPRHFHHRSSKYYDRSPRCHSKSPIKSHTNNSSSTSSEEDSPNIPSDEKISKTSIWPSKLKPIQQSTYKSEGFIQSLDALKSVKDEPAMQKCRNDLGVTQNYNVAVANEVISNNSKMTVVSEEAPKVLINAKEKQNINVQKIDVPIYPAKNATDDEYSLSVEKAKEKEEVDDLLNLFKMAHQKKMLDELSEKVVNIHQQAVPVAIKISEPPATVNSIPAQPSPQPVPELLPVVNAHCVPPLYSQPYSYTSPVVQNVTNLAPTNNNFTYLGYPPSASEPYAFVSSQQPSTVAPSTYSFYTTDSKPAVKTVKRPSDRICSLKTIPVVSDIKIEATPGEKHKAEEMKESLKKKLSILLQKSKTEEKIKDDISSYIEYYKKLSEERDVIQKQLHNTSDDVIELKNLKESLDKKSKESKSLVHKLIFSQYLVVLEKSTKVLKRLIDEGKNIDNEMKKVKEKLTPEHLQQLDNKNEDSSKKSDSSVIYSCYDSGNHWCHFCNQPFNAIGLHLEHLHFKKHRQRYNPQTEPWATKVTKGEKEVKSEANCHLTPVKGIEFIVPVSGFYCSLCKEALLDKSLAEQHLKSHEHTFKYKNYIKEHPVYEVKYELLKKIGLTDLQMENKKRLELEQKTEKNAKRQKMEAESDKLRDKLLEQEKNEKLEELEENSLEENSQASQTSSNIKLNLTSKEKPKSNDFKNLLKEAESKRKPPLVLIGRVPNYKPRPKFQSKKLMSEKPTKDAEKSQHENKFINDAIINSKEASPVKPSLNETASSTYVYTSGPSNNSNLIDSNVSSMPINDSPVSVTKQVNKKNKVVTLGCQSESEAKFSSISSDKESSPSTQPPKKEMKSLETKCEETVLNSETKNILNLPIVSESKGTIKLSEIKLPDSSKKYFNIPKQQSSATFPKTLSEEEKDLAMLGINKDDLMPMAIPKPPPIIHSSFIRSNNLSSCPLPVSYSNEGTTSAVVSTFLKPLPPFPPPLQVPPPNVVLKSNAISVPVNTVSQLPAQNVQSRSTGKRNLITIIPSSNLPTVSVLAEKPNNESNKTAKMDLEIPESCAPETSNNAENNTTVKSTCNGNDTSVNFKKKSEIKSSQQLDQTIEQKNVSESKVKVASFFEPSSVTKSTEIKKLTNSCKNIMQIMEILSNKTNEVATHGESSEVQLPCSSVSLSEIVKDNVHSSGCDEKCICMSGNPKFLQENYAMKDAERDPPEQHSPSLNVSSSVSSEDAVDKSFVPQMTSIAILSGQKSNDDMNQVIPQHSVECSPENMADNPKSLQSSLASVDLNSTLVVKEKNENKTAEKVLSPGLNASPKTIDKNVSSSVKEFLENKISCSSEDNSNGNLESQFGNVDLNMSVDINMPPKLNDSMKIVPHNIKGSFTSACKSENSAHGNVIECISDVIASADFKRSSRGNIDESDEGSMCEEECRPPGINNDSSTLHTFGIVIENLSKIQENCLNKVSSEHSALTSVHEVSCHEWHESLSENLKMHISPVPFTEKCDSDMSLDSNLGDSQLEIITPAENKQDDEKQVTAVFPSLLAEENKENLNISSGTVSPKSSLKGENLNCEAKEETEQSSIANEILNSPYNKPGMMATDYHHESDTDEYNNED